MLAIQDVRGRETYVGDLVAFVSEGSLHIREVEKVCPNVLQICVSYPCISLKYLDYNEFVKVEG